MAAPLRITDHPGDFQQCGNQEVSDELVCRGAFAEPRRVVVAGVLVDEDRRVRGQSEDVLDVERRLSLAVAAADPSVDRDVADARRLRIARGEQTRDGERFALDTPLRRV